MRLPAPAQLTNDGVQVGARVASFLLPAPKGTVTAAFIYQSGDAASENEARAIERALGAGLVVGLMQLKPRRLAIDALNELAGARVAFVTRGTDYREIAAATAARSILTISSDPACTRAGYCVVTISSAPKVQIIEYMVATNIRLPTWQSGLGMVPSCATPMARRNSCRCMNIAISIVGWTSSGAARPATSS